MVGIMYVADVVFGVLTADNSPAAKAAGAHTHPLFGSL
jgi:hypothetical protein